MVSKMVGGVALIVMLVIVAVASNIYWLGLVSSLKDERDFLQNHVLTLESQLNETRRELNYHEDIFKQLIDSIIGDDQKLEFLLFTDEKVYRSNENITIVMMVINPTNSTINLNFTSSYRYDYTIKSAEGALYTWSDGQVFLPFFNSVPIYRHNIFPILWQHSPQDYPLEPGRKYTIEGIVVGYFKDTVTIEIEL